MRARELFFVMQSALSLLSEGGSASRYCAAISRSASVSLGLRLLNWVGASLQADISLR